MSDHVVPSSRFICDIPSPRRPHSICTTNIQIHTAATHHGQPRPAAGSGKTAFGHETTITNLRWQLDDSQLDEQVCLNFNALRQRLVVRNKTIFNMQQNYGRERFELTHKIRALKQELADERRKNDRLGRACEDIDFKNLQAEPVCNQGCEQAPEPASKPASGLLLEQAPEQLSADRRDTQAEITKTTETIEPEWQPEKGAEATTLRYSRLGRAALVSSLTADSQRCTPPPQVAVESVEKGCVSDQRKRAKRSRRTGTPFEAAE